LNSHVGVDSAIVESNNYAGDYLIAKHADDNFCVVYMHFLL
jgi:hypothetical protein